MKTIVKIKLLLLCLYLFPDLQAQVSIGIMEAPADGALLQLKEIAGAAPGGKNTEKGLLMPRVELISHLSLYPLIVNASSAREMKNHIGLIVYNLTENPDLGLTEGLMVWNGILWNSIQEKKEKSENIGTDVKKNLYTNTRPKEDVSVPFHSIDIRMKEDINYTGYALPQFKIADSYQPVSGTRNYEYHISQYWNDGNPNTGKYSNEAHTRTFDSTTGYKEFTSGDMSPGGRNEVWMYDEVSNEIFHIQFFVIGENTTAATKIYAIMVEQF